MTELGPQGGTESIARASVWMDWHTPTSLQDSSPVEYIGGINDLPAGAHGYCTVELAPGDYAFIAEMPNPLTAGFVKGFTITPAK